MNLFYDTTTCPEAETVPYSRDRRRVLNYDLFLKMPVPFEARLNAPRASGRGDVTVNRDKHCTACFVIVAL